MKKFLKYLFLLVIVPSVLFISCQEDETSDPARQTDAEFQTLIAYLDANDMDLDDILTDWITTASAIKDDLTSYHILDIRSAADYAAGHIPGAINSSYADVVLNASNAGTKPVVVVCYSGQTAGHAVVALRLSGYNAKVLKWGMAGWHTSLTASWDNNVGDAAAQSANWVAAPGSIVDNKEFDDPDITETGDGATILAARVNALLNAGGLQGETGANVLASPGSYFVNNFWDATDVTAYGNIAGAYRIKPLTITGGEYTALDPSKTVVTYCWTGQTSSVVTAYLYVLGYDAKSLKFGVNSMIYSDLTSHKWDATAITDLPLE